MVTVLRTSGSARSLDRRLRLRRAFRERFVRGHGRRARFKHRVLPEHRLLQLPQRQAGLDPELLDEHASGLLVRLQRLRLTTRPVESAHQLAAQLLSKGVRGDEGLELPDEIARGGRAGARARPARRSPEDGDPRAARSPSERSPRRQIPGAATLARARVLHAAVRPRSPGRPANAPRRRVSRSGRDRAARVRGGADNRGPASGSVRGWCLAGLAGAVAAGATRMSGSRWPPTRALARPRCRRSAVRSRRPRSRAGAGSGRVCAPWRLANARRRLSRRESRGGRGREIPCARLRVRLCSSDDPSTRPEWSPAPLQRPFSVPGALLCDNGLRDSRGREIRRRRH